MTCLDGTDTILDILEYCFSSRQYGSFQKHGGSSPDTVQMEPALKKTKGDSVWGKISRIYSNNRKRHPRPYHTVVVPCCFLNPGRSRCCRPRHKQPRVMPLCRSQRSSVTSRCVSEAIRASPTGSKTLRRPAAESQLRAAVEGTEGHIQLNKKFGNLNGRRDIALES